MYSEKKHQPNSFQAGYSGTEPKPIKGYTVKKQNSSAEVKARARGQWLGILKALAGLVEYQLSGRHQPCPICGGQDRYRFDDKTGNGDYYCNQCGPGDGFTMLKKLHGWDFATVVNRVAEYLHMPHDAYQKGFPDSEKYRLKLDAAQKAVNEWQAASPAMTHEYLTRKGVLAHGLRVSRELLIPGRDECGALWMLQRITHTGEKRYWPKGCRKKGLFHLLGDIDGVLAFAEGYATGATIHEVLGLAVAITFDSGNLLPVASRLRPRLPGVRFIFAADNDVRTDNNVGVISAQEAAKQTQGVVVAPAFSPAQYGVHFSSHEAWPTDFNDLFLLAGADAVRLQFLEVIQ